jgi:proteic killer suppression protein
MRRHDEGHRFYHRVCHGGQELLVLQAERVQEAEITLDVSFKGKWAETVFGRQQCRGLSPGVQRTAYRKLMILDTAGALSDLRVPPGNRLEKMSKDRAGRHSIRINAQWRICFVWKQGDACDVEIADYH